MKIFWRWLLLSLFGWFIVPIAWAITVGPLVSLMNPWILGAWLIAVPFISYYRAKGLVRRSEAREAERMAAAVAEGVRRANKL